MEDSLGKVHVDSQVQEDELGDKSTPLVQQDLENCKISSTRLVENENVTSRLSGEGTEAKNESITTEVPCELAESEDNNTKVKLADVKDEISTNITNQLSNEHAQFEDNVKTTFPNESTESEEQDTTTKHPRKVTKDEGKIIACKTAQKQTGIEDTIVTTESQNKKQAVDEGESIATEIQCVGEQKFENNATNMSVDEQAEFEKKSKIQVPEFPSVSVETESKDTTSKPPCDLGGDENKITVTYLTLEQTKIKGKIVSTKSHKHAETEGKIIADELTHMQVEQDKAEIKKLQEEYFTLDNITNLLHDAFLKKGQLIALIDEKQERYEVDFKIQGFSVDNGNFESELEKDIEILNHLLKQKETDRDDAIKESDQLWTQIKEQSIQLKEINEQLGNKNTLQLQLRNKVSSLSNTIDELKKKIQVRHTEIAEMFKVMKANQHSIAKGEKQLEADTATRRKFRDKKSTIERDLEKNRKSLQELDQAIEKVNKELQNIESKTSDYKDQQTKMQKDMEDNETNHFKSAKEMDDIKCSLKEINIKHDDLKREQSQMLLLLDKVKGELEKSCNQKRELQQTYDENNKKVILVQEALCELDNNVKNCEKEILNLEKDAFEFQERNDVLILSCKACAKLKIKEMHEKLKKESLKSIFGIWNGQIKSLQADVRQLLERFKEHMKVIEVQSVTSFKPIHVLENIEIGYLQSLECTTKTIYVLNATIQHCMYQINLDGFMKSFSGEKCNESDEDEEGVAETEDESKGINAKANPPREVAAAKGKIKKVKLPCKQAEFKDNISTDLPQTESENAKTEVSCEYTDMDQKGVIDLATCAKENRIRLHHICKAIDCNLVKLYNARHCHEKHLLDYILQQISFWNEMEQPMNLFSQSLIDIETMIGTEEITKIICHIDDEASMIESIETIEELQKLVKLLNKFYCSRSVTSIVDCQLALLKKNNEELKSSNATTGDSVATSQELKDQELEIHRLEVEKQQGQKNLHIAQQEIKTLTTKDQQLQEEIQKKVIYVSELTNTLRSLQHSAQLKQTEIDSIATKVLQRKEIQEIIKTFNDNLVKHRQKLESLQLQLQEFQSRKHEFGVAKDTKEEIYVDSISKLQSTIHTTENKIHSYEEELAELNEAEKKKPEVLKFLSSLSEDIIKHQLKIESINLSIKEIRSELDKNASILEEHKKEEVSQSSKLLDLSNKLNKKTQDYNQAIERLVDCMVEATIQKAVQIEENELKIKMLIQNKTNLLSHEKTKSVAEKQLKFEQQLHSLDEEQQEKRKALKMHQDSLEFNKKELQQIENNNRSIDKQIEAHKKLILNQEEEKQKIQTNQQAVEIQLQNLTQSAHDMSQKLADCEKNLAQLKSKQQELEHKITGCKGEMSKIKTKEQEVTKHLNKKRGSKSSLENKSKKLDIELITIKNDLEKLDDSIKKQLSALNNQRKVREDLKTENSKLQKNLDEIRGILKQREDEREVVESNSQCNIIEMKSVNVRKKEVEDRLAIAKTDYEASLKQEQKFQEKYDKVKVKFNDIECIKQQKEKLYYTLEKIKTQLNEVKWKKDKQFDGIWNVLKNVLGTLDQVNMQVNNREEKFKKEKECLNNQVKTLKNEVDQQKKESDVLAMKVEGVEKQSRSLEKQNSNIKRKSEDLQLENKKLQKEIERLELARSSSVPRPIKGLENLGNTCFFNSMLQGVNQVTTLCQLLTNSRKATLEYEVPWPWPSSTEDDKPLKLEVKSKPRPFAQALWEFYQEIDSHRPYLRPSSLLYLIGQKNSRFLGRNQQDSHEAFRCLLDGLRMEEILAVKEEIYKRFGTTEQEHKVSSKKLSPENNKLLKGYLRKANKVITTVDEVFGGTLVNTIVCHECNDTPQTFEAFLDLSLPITKDKTIHGSMREASKKLISNDDGTLQKYLASKKNCKHKPLQHGIQLSLDEFTNLDELDEDNKFICKLCTAAQQKRCGRDDVYALRNVSKSLIIHKLPKILVLHIKRFHLEPVVRKDNDHVSFTKVLDMTPYCTTECIEEYQTKYTLFTVVVHSGSLQSGHYTAYVNVKDDKWYYTSDSHISECHNGFKEVENCQAYMLFYKQNNN